MEKMSLQRKSTRLDGILLRTRDSPRSKKNFMFSGEERSLQGTIQAHSKYSARERQKGVRDKIRKASMQLSWRLLISKLGELQLHV